MIRIKASGDHQHTIIWNVKVNDSRQLNKEIVEYSDSHVCADTFWWITNDNDKLAIARQKCDGL